MTDNPMCTLVLARALSVEPIARALCPDPYGNAQQPFARSPRRWRDSAARAALAHCATPLLPMPSAAARWRPFLAPHLR